MPTRPLGRLTKRRRDGTIAFAEAGVQEEGRLNAAASARQAAVAQGLAAAYAISQTAQPYRLPRAPPSQHVRRPAPW
jgi:hypothetical protein